MPSRPSALLCALVLVLTGSAHEAPAAVIDVLLQEQIGASSPAEGLPVLIVLSEQGLSEAQKRTLRGLPSGERARRGYALLRERAAIAQAAPLAALNRLALTGTASEIRPLVLLNAIRAVLTPAGIREIAVEPGVARIVWDPIVPAEALADTLVPPASGLVAPGLEIPRDDQSLHGRGGDDSGRPARGDHGETPRANAWQVTRIRAPEVWAAGHRGEGVIVAMLDSGIDFSHPDLAGRIYTNPLEIASNGLDDDGNGYIDDVHGWDWVQNDNDPSGITESDHGTKCAGLIVGDGTGGQSTGIAPLAQVLPLRVSPAPVSAIIQGLDYAAALGSPVISMSLSEKWQNRPDYGYWRTVTDNELALGLVHCNSIGNEGGDTERNPVPFNIATPGNCPSAWLHPDQYLAGGLGAILAVGSVDSGDNVTPSSGRGPSAWEDLEFYLPGYPYEMPEEFRDYPYRPDSVTLGGLVKPDLCAPGLNTVTTRFGGGYVDFSGTSAATPVAAGAVALLLGADPTLTPQEISLILQSTAVDRGAPGKDREYGAGRIDVYAALLLALQRHEYGFLAGSVRDAETSAPLLRVPVSIDSAGGTRIFFSNSIGNYSAWSRQGEYRIRASWPGYLPDTLLAVVTGDSTTTIDIALRPIPPPELLAPADSSAGVERTLLLAWSSAEGAVSYDLELALDPEFAELAGSWTALADTGRMVGPLPPEVWHYWRVRSSDGSGTSRWSDPRSFLCRPATPPLLVAPPDSAVGQPRLLELAWTSTPAVAYRVQASQDSTFEVLDLDHPGLADTSLAIGLLQYETTYFWRVEAIESDSARAWSAVRRFSTTPVLPPLLTEPADASIELPRHLVLRWLPTEGFVDDGRREGDHARRGGQARPEILPDSDLRYHVQVALSEDFEEVLLDTTDLAQTELTVSGLGQAVTVHWRVRAIDGFAQSAWSQPFRFTTRAVRPPALITPPDGATEQPLAVPLTWRSTPHAVAYRLLAARDALFEDPVLRLDLPDTTAMLGPLWPGTAFHWKVEAVEDDSARASSPAWQFMTRPLTSPTLVEPADLAEGTERRLALHWISGGDGDTLTYRVQLSTLEDFTTTVIDTSWIPAGLLEVSRLEPERNHFWRARARDAHTESAWSTAFRFRPRGAVAPVVSSPPDGAADQPRRLSVEWRGSGHAITYRLQMARDPLFEDLVTDRPGIADTVLALGPLRPGTTHYWRVEATEEDSVRAWSATATFVTAPIPSPLLIEPPDLAGGTERSLTLRWEPPVFARRDGEEGGSRNRSPQGDTLAFAIQLADNESFDPVLVDSTGIGGTELRIGSLGELAGYWWRVRATDGYTESGWTDPFRFTTRAAYAPQPDTPEDGAVNQPKLTTLRWRPTPAAIAYRARVALDTLFTSPLIDQAGITDTLTAIGPLPRGVECYWQVQATEADSARAWSGVRGFHIIPLSAPMLASPADSVQEHPTRPDLFWHPVEDAVAYELQLSDYAGFDQNVQTWTAIADTNRSVGPLAEEGWFFWRVRADGLGSPGPWSAPRALRTRIEAAAFVYPGDANNDGLVDARDILPIGLHYGRTGATRVSGSLQWRRQVLRTAWEPFESCFADCDGNGEITAQDVLGLVYNWGRPRGTILLTSAEGGDEATDAHASGDSAEASAAIPIPAEIQAGAEGGDGPAASRLVTCLELVRALDPLIGSPGFDALRAALVDYMRQELGYTLDFDLRPNRPNPFRGATSWALTVPHPASGEITLFDLGGRLVWRRELARIGTGSHVIEWDGRDLGGRRVPSGIYAYRLSLGSYRASGRAVILR